MICPRCENDVEPIYQKGDRQTGVEEFFYCPVCETDLTECVYEHIEDSERERYLELWKDEM